MAVVHDWWEHTQLTLRQEYMGLSELEDWARDLLRQGERQLNSRRVAEWVLGVADSYQFHRRIPRPRVPRSRRPERRVRPVQAMASG